MDITLREVGPVVVLELNGNLTIGRGDVRLRETFAEVLASGRKQVLLDLADVGYMDSAGIGELVACSKRARASSAALKLLKPSSKVREMLEITRFADLFESFEDEQLALRSF